MQPALSNTIALSLRDVKLDQMRVQFQQVHRWNLTNFTYESVDAVYCKDMYADEIEKEKNKTWSTSYFTQTFSGKVWKEK